MLLDYASWAQQNDVALDAVSRHAITISELEAVAKAQQVEFHAGDILVVRTGLMVWYKEHTDEERVKYITHGKAGVGVQASAHALEWLWDHHFTAVASDSVGFEAWPKEDEVRKSNRKKTLARSRVSLTNISSARSPVGAMGNANWRIVGSGSVVERMYQAEAMELFLDEFSSQHHGWSSKPTQRDCDILKGQAITYSIECEQL